jgi:hypothetical protein
VNIYCINKSSVITDQQLQSWIPAFNKFIGHVRTYWPRPATAVFCDRTKEPSLAWKLIFADTSDVAGALGYHDYTPDGRPISYVFAVDDIRYGYSPTVTATHEIAEMIADPWISEAVQISNTQFFAKEIADPCEADQLGFDITVEGFQPILCSDFVLPNWFIPGAGSKYDFMGHISKSLQILAGGYMSVFTSGKGWSQIYAEKVSPTTTRFRKPSLDEEKVVETYSRLARYARDRGPALKLT